MDDTATETVNLQRAEALQQIADRLTAVREQSAPVLAAAVGLSRETWVVTAAVGASMLTDFLDGYYAKKATMVRGFDVPTDGGETDPRADHKLMQGLFTGLAVRALRQGRWLSSGLLASTLVVSNLRDARMDENRRRVNDLGLDRRELRANKFNKVKMFAQSLGAAALVSPLGRHCPVKSAALAAVTAGTISGLVGERKFRQKVDKLNEPLIYSEA